MSNQTDKFYNRFSFLYPVVDLFLKPQKRRLFDEVNSVPFGDVLEIGVGNGSHLQLYKTHKIVCIDTSVAMLEIARKHKNENIELREMNGESLLFQNQTFDYVILSHVVAVVDNPEKSLEEAYRVLKPHGKIFILNHFTPTNWLRYVDKAVHNVSKVFHFKSFFYVESLTTLKRFTLVKEVAFHPWSYFKLLIYDKA